MDSETNNYKDLPQPVSVITTPKPILLVDMDGVVANYYANFLRLYTKKYPDREFILPEDLSEFYIENLYPPKFKHDILEITRGKDFFKTMPVVKDSVSVLNAILAEGKFDPYLCSSPDIDCENQTCHSEKAQWIEHVMGKPWVKRMILTNDKTLVQGAYLIDDKPLIKGINSTPSWKHIVFDWAYNRSTPGIRLNGWADWVNLKDKL